jgi:hypothetical protein
MMAPYEEQLDQQRCNQQDSIAEEVFIQGFSDGLDGIPPQSEDEPYKLGYAQGKVQLYSNYQANRVGDNYNPCHKDEWLEDYGEF